MLTGCGAQLAKKTDMTKHKYTNALIDESSPYLLQHAHNPVDWQPWGEAALAQAKKENKLLIISVGYAACHWCHVMEHESFEDTLVAKIMNENFIPIKVDREERPDVDDVYMTACNLVSGRGGWPLNAFALPDGKPVWAGTYFPRDQWIKVLEQFIDLQKTDPARLQESAEKLTSGISNRDDMAIVNEQSEYTTGSLDRISNVFLSTIDMDKGGRNGAPKFPMPNNYEYLMRYSSLAKSQQAKDAVETTLDEMAYGGIYDQIGGGFARYSVDALWHVPHFEKMTYDNGQLVSLYAKGYQQSGKAVYKDVVTQTLDYVAREMTSPEGGFYSSLDADSEGVEGKFYVWTKAEIDSLIEPQEHKLIYEYYNITEAGNWEHGNNILRRLQSDELYCKEQSVTQDELKALKVKWHKVLMTHRDTRVRPGLDDKILTSWNALMAKGYVDAYIALGDESYLAVAKKNLSFLLKNQKSGDHRLNRNYKNGKSSINGFLDDYALLIDALMAMYQATFDITYLDEADAFAQYTVKHFMKAENGMFNYTSDVDPPLVARTSEVSDNVIPASNSMMARNLKTLGELLYNKEYSQIAQQMLQNMTKTLETTAGPSFYSNWLQLYLEMVYPSYEVAIMGDDYENIRKKMMKNYHPNAVFLGGAEEGKLKLLEAKLPDSETLIYVCQNKACKFPVSSVDKAMTLIK